MLSNHTDTLLSTITDNPAYRLAQEDLSFLAREELRGVRLMVEYLKPDISMRERHINSTVVVFGSARIKSDEEARELLAQAQSALDRCTDADNQPALQLAVKQAEKALHYARFYEEARHFAQLVSCQFKHDMQRDFVIITGGGPGIMMAANQGAFESGCESIGLNITLPHEQQPNPFITPDLAFRFHYFALRKMHFLIRARALVAFPGGYGTLDELTEALTLIQTRKMDRIPIILFGKSFWDQLLNIPFLVAEGMISPEDVDLVTYVETAQEAFQVLQKHYGEDFGYCPVPTPRTAL